MNITKFSFYSLELIAFILPTLPPQLWARLSILLLYFTLHYFKVHKMYSGMKCQYIQNM